MAPAEAEEHKRSYALVWSETPLEAADALKQLEGHAIPAHIGLEAVVFGKAYLLAGRVDEAIPLLRRAAASCTILPRVDFGVTIATIFWMRAHVLLGQALETKSDKAGGCAAYRVVMDRWKDAKPRSTTLEKAKARSKALACGT